MLLPAPPHRASSRRRQKRAARVAIAVFLALVGHAVLLTLLEISGVLENFTPPALQLVQSADAARQNPPDEPLQIETLVESLEHPPKLTEAEKKQKDEEDRKDQKGQVVDIAKPAIEMRPDIARFLAEHDSKVAKETKGAIGKGQAGAPTPPAPPPLPLPPPPIATRPTPQPVPGPKSSVLSMRGPLGTKIPGPSNAAAEIQTLGPDGNLAHQAGAGAVRPPETPGAGAVPNSSPPSKPVPNLLPSRQALQQTMGMGSGSPDYLEDLEDASSTSLNSKKWTYADFFNRVKRAVAEEWHPDELLKQHDPQGNIYGAVDRKTVLKVRLTPEGRVADVKVAKSSGVDFLDAEAMSAFARGQPYINPPPGLVESDKFIRFNFGFIVQLSGRTSFKFYKYSD